MIIGIDGNEANLITRVGVGQYAYNILNHLYKHPENTYYIYLKSPPLIDLPPEAPHWHYLVFGPKILWTKIALPFFLYTRSPKIDLFYSPSHYSPHFSPYPTIPTIHDLGYLNTPEEFNKKDIHQLTSWTYHSIKKAAKIIAVSEFTKHEINRIYQIPLQKIHISFNGIDKAPSFSKIDITHTLSKYQLDSPYFLYLGTLKPNKNISFLIKVFSKFSHTNPNYKLVIAGKKGWQFDTIFSQVTTLKLIDKVVFTGYISEKEKWILFQNAKASVLPSLYEGFGIPAIESQLMKTPVIASNIPAYIEIIKGSSILIDPRSELELFEALTNICTSKIRQQLVNLGTKNCQKYTWEKSARSLLKAFDTI